MKLVAWMKRCYLSIARLEHLSGLCGSPQVGYVVQELNLMYLGTARPKVGSGLLLATI